MRLSSHRNRLYRRLRLNSYCCCCCSTTATKGRFGRNNRPVGSSCSARRGNARRARRSTFDGSNPSTRQSLWDELQIVGRSPTLDVVFLDEPPARARFVFLRYLDDVVFVERHFAGVLACEWVECFVFRHLLLNCCCRSNGSTTYRQFRRRRRRTRNSTGLRLVVRIRRPTSPQQLS
jgi:hypothetical protein